MMLITGAAGGVGSACVRVFSEEGWQVIGVDRNDYPAPYPQDGLFIRADISNPQELEGIYARVKTFLQDYNPYQTSVHLEWQEIYAFFRSIFLLGVIGQERREYWKLFFWSLYNYPKKFPLAITFTIYGFHFRKVSELQGL